MGTGRPCICLECCSNQTFDIYNVLFQFETFVLIIQCYKICLPLLTCQFLLALQEFRSGVRLFDNMSGVVTSQLSSHWQQVQLSSPSLWAWFSSPWQWLQLISPWLWSQLVVFPGVAVQCDQLSSSRHTDHSICWYVECERLYHLYYIVYFLINHIRNLCHIIYNLLHLLNHIKSKASLYD